MAECGGGAVKVQAVGIGAGSTQTPVPDSHLFPDLSTVPHVSPLTGSGPWLGMLCLWLLLTIGLPLVTGVWWLVLVGLAVLAHFSWRVVVDGVLRQAPAPPRTLPFTSTPLPLQQGITSVVVIVNPRSGQGQGQVILDTVVLPGLIRAGLGEGVKIYSTCHRRHAVELCQALPKDPCMLVIAVGGDGTLHEVVNGLLIRGEGPALAPLLCLIPGGSGNSVLSDIYPGALGPGEVFRRCLAGAVHYTPLDVNHIKLANLGK